MRKTIRYIIIIIVSLFALIGMAFTGVYLAMQFGLTNVRGSIEERNTFFGAVPKSTQNGTNETTEESVGNGCAIGLDQTKPCEWNETVQWDVVKGGLKKDQEIIKRVAAETGVSPRMIAAAVVPEQVRFFTDNREVFKRYFEPLKILVSLSQFSLGVSGIKQKTAQEIEGYANDPTSPFYPGDTMNALIAYSATTTDKDTELFNRLTDEKDHYYSYLYTALFLKQVTAQWQAAGYNIEKRPDVLVTLFNLGFTASQPKDKPQVGGAPITIGDQRYSFGELGATFYHSDELLAELPK